MNYLISNFEKKTLENTKTNINKSIFYEHNTNLFHLTNIFSHIQYKFILIKAFLKNAISVKKRVINVRNERISDG